MFTSKTPIRNPIIYEIRVQDHLGEEWASWFEPLVIHNEPNGEATLTGPIRDQSELFGLLAKVRDLNIILVAVNRMQPSQSND